jgi:hypothetical protein
MHLKNFRKTNNYRYQVVRRDVMTNCKSTAVKRLLASSWLATVLVLVLASCASPPVPPGSNATASPVATAQPMPGDAQFYGFWVSQSKEDFEKNRGQIPIVFQFNGHEHPHLNAFWTIKL